MDVVFFYLILMFFGCISFCLRYLCFFLGVVGSFRIFFMFFRGIVLGLFEFGVVIIFLYVSRNGGRILYRVCFS